MPRAFLVKKTRGASSHKSDTEYDAEYVDSSGSKSTDHCDPRQHFPDTAGRTQEPHTRDLKTDIWKKHYLSFQDETTAVTSSNGLAEPMDLSQAKPILRVSSNSAFDYVESSMPASHTRPSNSHVSRDGPLDLQVRPTTDRDFPQSPVTKVSSTSSSPINLYNTHYASHQKRPNLASALYTYMMEGAAATRASPFQEPSFYQYSVWNHGRSDWNTGQFPTEEQLITSPSPNPSPNMRDYCNASPGFYPHNYISSSVRKIDGNVEEIQSSEQQLALNPSPSEEDRFQLSPQLPNPEKSVFSHNDSSRRTKNQRHVLKHSARQPILGLEYIQNTPNFQDSNSLDGDFSQLSKSQDQGADGCLQLDQEINCSSEQQHTGYASPGSATISSGETSPSEPDKPSQYKKYICDVCGKGFSRSNTLVTHKRIHTGDKPFKCELCGRAFRQPGNLTRHRLTHTTVKPYVCQQCGKAFNRASNLHTHMRTHTNYKPFTCQYCGKGFHQKIDMKIHSYTHTGEKPHKCKKCGRGFKQLTHLTYHLRTHSDIKMYTCAYCGKGFNQKGNLQAHIYGHTGERPYHCEVCSKGFTLASTLNTHRRTHAEKKPYACQHCHKDFYQKNALKSHVIASHTYTGKSLL